ncbi:alpha/beta hydrolase [Nocardia uniformis]|uniref:Alpha/beta hydrolase n=1 Tax=Nocardia uniformis TaxID=53432 RepID=A0A849C051_9NOCA|nr:alpha/beta hydrolase [Nocardia uniformis]NNH69257.1 alpha/beta hydrolase [Nocardia uniformis]
MSHQPFHPDLRIARLLPRTIVGPRNLWLIRRLTAILDRPRSDVDIIRIDAEVSVRVFRPSRPRPRPRTPALLWIHGGGYVLGTAAQDDRFCRRIADQLDITVASVDYRVAPEHPFPTPLHDCYSAWRWLSEQPDVDAQRLAIGGASAGAGLAAALTLLTKERGTIQPVLQMLSYPMLDDRTTTRAELDRHRVRLWNADSNRFGWRSYLGPAYGNEISPLAAPARYDDLTGLPTTWLGVGTNDLFHDENLAYVQRLEQAGVDCTLHVTPGGYHAFDMIEPKAAVSQTFRRSQVDALDSALNDGTNRLTDPISDAD